MSEKRFNFDYEYAFEIYDTITKKHYDGRVGCQEKLCDLLNSLSDENEQMRSIIKLANKFIVKKGLQKEYRNFKREVDVDE